MNVLSLFDGMSCGRLALDRLGIKVDKYYAAEIDKYAIQVSEDNYPDTVRLGDVCGVKAENLPKIDLILAGSPCQGFSFAGKQLAFDDPRSVLFFEFVRILKECRPKYFLLENVRMKKEFLDVISQQVGVEPILINSALLSAQNRQRYYWTNIPGVEQPEQQGIVLRDILETGFNSERDKSHCLDANYYKGGSVKNYFKKSRRQMVYQDDTNNLPDKSSVIKSNYYKSSRANFENDKSKGGKFSATGIPQTTTQKKIEKNKRYLDEKSVPLLASTYKGIGNNGTTLVPVHLETHDTPQTTQDKPIKVGMNVEEVKVRKHEVDMPSLQRLLRESKKTSGKTNKQIAEETDLPITKVEHWFRTDSSFAIPSDDVWFKLKEVLAISEDTFDAQIMEFEYRDGVFESTQRVYSENGKSPTLTAGNKEQYIETHDKPKRIHLIPKEELNDFVRQRSVYSEVGKSPCLLARSDSPKIMKETHDTPKQVAEIDMPGHDILKRVYSVDGKSPTVTAHAGKGTVPKIETHNTPKQVGTASDINGHDILKRVYSPDGKAPTLTTNGGGNREPKVVGGAWRGRAYDQDGKHMDKDGESVANKTQQMLELRNDAKSNAITTVGKDSLVVEDEVYWRKLIPVECERLQTVPDNYTDSVSNTQRYKMLGNGWTIDVIAHILKNMQILEEGGDLPESKGQTGFDF